MQQRHSTSRAARAGATARGPVAALTATVALGIAIFFSLYSFLPVTRPGSPELSSLFLGTMMAFVMGVQVFAPVLVRKFTLRVVLGASVSLLGAGALATALSSELFALLAGAVAGGAGFGILVVTGAQGVALLVPPESLGRALGLYGLITMAAAAVGAPAGVQLAVAFSPTAFGICALIAGVVGASLAFGVPIGVERKPEPVPATAADARERVEGCERLISGRLHAVTAGVPWAVLVFLLLGVVMLSHGLTSLPALAAASVNPALLLFGVQAANAVGRWLGGELDGRIPASATTLIGAIAVVAGGTIGVLLAGTIPALSAAVLVGAGAGIIQTVTLHTTMQRMDAGRASVVWNLAVDGGLWAGGVLWGLALAYGLVPVSVLLLGALVIVAGALVAWATRGRTV
ncbi:MFS transporter [uncultured Agrococcus sp.]|uniref:MFS transporter n=1 Tax=uncultured Agrococcus sp. TaxID=382258 RepID=UPI0025D92A14|nr:MFS transporter [uncultured Agrococcus sp.]